MKIPYGIHDYKTIKNEDYLYVDKTNYIEKIENIGKYIVFLRPRRFGKSLFTSMLYYYYDIKSRDLFDSLFNDTYIGKNKTKEVNSYYILKFDFSGISTEKEIIKEQFAFSVRMSLRECINYYNLDIKIDDKLAEANAILKDFLTQFKAKTNKQIYLLIDEYDHFANNVLTSDENLFKQMLGRDGFVRNFYEVFKTYAGSIIGRMFITGVTPITLDSLTSGFNNAKNFAKHELLNEMMGFTEEEVLKILEEANIDRNHLITLKENYNGYLFNQDCNTRVYNSNMVLYYLDNMILLNKPPDNLTDSNIVSDYTKITRMFDLYKNTEDKKEIINAIIADNLIEAEIIDKFSLEMGFDRKHFLSLLYYLGLLTIDGMYGTTIKIKTPNYVIRNVYYEYYFYYLNKIIETNVDISNVTSAINELSLNNNISRFKELIENLLRNLSNRDYIKFDEKYVKLLILSYLSLSKAYLVKSEYEVEAGYIDIALLPNHVYNANNYYIFEVKYIKKTDYTEEKLNQKRQEAIEQINKYAESKEMQQIQNLRKYIIVVVNDECKIIEEIKFN